MEHVRVEVNDGIAEVVMNRPKVNAPDWQLLDELARGGDVLVDDGVSGVGLAEAWERIARQTHAERRAPLEALRQSRG
ncbi:MAG TPA: hypothetical protein ENK57_07020 [Polyangiaceae bacterium]|nr:hypothetical protein [Polyangiaceae bacterium]